MTDLSLTVEKLIPAPPKRVYDAWLDPATLTRFLQHSKGVRIPRATTEPRVGGQFEIVMNTGKADIPHTGTYLELVPHSRIVFTWTSPYSAAEGSTVTLTFQPQGSGTLVTLTHVRFLTESSRDGHRVGWADFLESLAKTDL